MPALTAAGVRVYALSYDEAEPLRDFAAAHDISYRFLSDPESDVIRAFGILNTIIAEDDHPWFGIPYPGTYVMDSAGLITHKFFENNLAVRVGPDQLVRAVRGQSINEAVPQPEGRAESHTSDVTADVFLAGDALALSVQSELVARFQVPAGRHVYAEPAPAGSIAVSLELDASDGLVTRALLRPTSEMHTLADTDEAFPVHHGTVELRLPLTVNGDAYGKNAPREVRLRGRLRWQSCDDTVCDIPITRPFDLVVPLDAMVPSALVVRDGEIPGEPRGRAHFQQMVDRRQRD